MGRRAAACAAVSMLVMPETCSVAPVVMIILASDAPIFIQALII
jgi:hypothetical protein